MNHFSKKEITLLTILSVLVFFSTFLSRNTRLYDKGIVHTGDTYEILLHDATNAEGLSQQLDSLDIDFDKEELIWAAGTLGWKNYQPGRYLLTDAETYSAFLSKLSRGIQDPAPVTIIPGMNMERLAWRLSEQLRADSTSFHQIFDDSSDIAREYDLTGEQLFARMLPETYQIYWTSPPENVIRRVLSEFERVVIDQYKNEVEQNSLDLNEILTLASIVELESRLNSEKPTVSGLYLNRLEKEMPLQADPTVSYALGENRRLLYKDYELDHPYNTYRIQGLPPGPITNPDLSSIRAVLRPENHDYLYMVATPEGGHRFSETFSEHQQASEEWRKWIREQYRIRSERESEESSSEF